MRLQSGVPRRGLVAAGLPFHDEPTFADPLVALTLDQIGSLLRSSDFFSAVSEETIIDFARLAQEVSLSTDQVLFVKGELGSAMYVVVEGCVRVHIGDVVIARLERGQVFGEVAALSAESRTASVIAERDSELLKLEHEAIFSIVASKADVAKSIIEALCRRETQIIGEKFERILKARVLERELDIGQRIQLSFLPGRIPELDGWQLQGMLKPARKVAGDFFDYFYIPRLQCLGIVIGDVCDKGVGAALFMALFRSLIRSGALHGPLPEPVAGDDVATSTVRHTIRSTNEYIATTHADSSMFASVFFGLLAPDTGTLTYVNAGHEPLLVADASGIRLELPPTGPVIGLFEGAEYGVGRITVWPGEFLFGYTDGATDAQNGAGEAFSEQRLFALLRDGAAADPGSLQRFFLTIDEFVGGVDRYDDITMIGAFRQPGVVSPAV